MNLNLNPCQNVSLCKEAFWAILIVFFTFLTLTNWHHWLHLLFTWFMNRWWLVLSIVTFLTTDFFLKSVNRVLVCTCISTYPRNDGEELKKKYFIFYLTILFGKAADIYHNYAPINNSKMYIFLTGSIKNKRYTTLLFKRY